MHLGSTQSSRASHAVELVVSGLLEDGAPGDAAAENPQIWHQGAYGSGDGGWSTERRLLMDHGAAATSSDEVDAEAALAEHLAACGDGGRTQWARRWLAGIGTHWSRLRLNQM